MCVIVADCLAFEVLNQGLGNPSPSIPIEPNTAEKIIPERLGTDGLGGVVLGISVTAGSKS